MGLTDRTLKFYPQIKNWADHQAWKKKYKKSFVSVCGFCLKAYIGNNEKIQEKKTVLHKLYDTSYFETRIGPVGQGTELKLACIFVCCEATMAIGVWYLMSYGEKSTYQI